MGALTGRSASSFLVLFPLLPTPFCTFDCCTAGLSSHWIWMRTHPYRNWCKCTQETGNHHKNCKERPAKAY